MLQASQRNSQTDWQRNLLQHRLPGFHLQKSEFPDGGPDRNVLWAANLEAEG
jgi:hypothetical protein